MSEPKKPTTPKAIADVAHPGKSSPSDTSKSIITHRPIMKDPMVVEDNADKPEDTGKKPMPKKAGETKIEPPKPDKKSEPAGTLVPKDTDEKTDEKPSEPDKEPDTEPKPEEAGKDIPDDAEKTGDDKADTDKDKKSKQPKPEDEAKAAAQAEQDAKLQKIIDSKKYFLPINAVEQRRSAHFVAFGIILALLLALAWGDIAADAGLIHVKGIKPVTHFFSN